MISVDVDRAKRASIQAQKFSHVSQTVGIRNYVKKIEKLQKRFFCDLHSGCRRSSVERALDFGSKGREFKSCRRLS